MRLSIIIPVHNAERYLEETMISALAQTVADKEIIVVDDGSTDATTEILATYRNRIHIVRLPISRGAAHAHNVGVLHSQAPYLLFLEAQDLLFPAYSQILLDQMFETQVDIGFANLYVLEDRTPTTLTLYGSPRHPSFVEHFGGPQEQFPQAPHRLRQCALSGPLVSPRAVYRRQRFLDWGLEPEGLGASHAWYRNAKFIGRGARVLFQSTPLGFYRWPRWVPVQPTPWAIWGERVRAVELLQQELHGFLLGEEVGLLSRLHQQYCLQLFTELVRADQTLDQMGQVLLEMRG